MFVAGGLVWANLVKTQIIHNVNKHGAGFDFTTTSRGWPWRWSFEVLNATPVMLPEGVFYTPGVGSIYWKDLTVDILTALAILFTAAFACERLIRRREACTP